MDFSYGESPYLPPIAISQMVSIKSVFTFTGSPLSSVFSIFKSNGFKYTFEPVANLISEPQSAFASGT